MCKDGRFSFDRLKSFSFKSLCSWAATIADIDSSFVRCLLCIL